MICILNDDEQGMEKKGETPKSGSISNGSLMRVKSVLKSNKLC